MPGESSPHERTPLARGNRVQLRHAEEAPLHHLEHVLARSAETLHSEQGDLETCWLGGVRGADVAAAVAVRCRDLVRCPVARERLDVATRHAALAFCPLGGLWLSVSTAEHVVLEPVEAVGVRGDVVMIIGVFGEPDPRDAEPERRIGIRVRGDPLVGVNGCAVVQIGADVDAFDAALAPEVADAARHLAAPAPRSRLRVAAHKDNRIGILRDVVEQVRLMRLLPDRILPPHVLGAPVPALPGVRLTCF